ncbi:MAG: pyridoxamine 5'-phosphate oxidase family protein [Acidimicrobiales bacterium]
MHTLDPLDPDVWRTVRRTLARGQRTSLHCAIASTAPDGRAYVSPIGSVRLGPAGTGTYLDVFNAQLRRNLEHDPRVTVMAVDSGLVTWVRALVTGRFATSPGVRLLGEAGPARPASDDEKQAFQRSVRPALLTRGGRAMWGRFDDVVARDLTFTDVVPVRIGSTTAGLWATPPRSPSLP